MQRCKWFHGVLTFVLVSFLASMGVAQAASFSFTGTFTQDDDVQLFSFVIGIPTTVTLLTYSYAGGTNAAGIVIPAGGFDPILSLFDSLGTFIDEDNDDDDFVSPDVIDPTTGRAYRFVPPDTLAAGTYTVSLTQFDNFATGPTLADGFFRQGEGNFTGIDFGPGSGSFFDDTESQRTNSWALDILNVQQAQLVPGQVVPEPGSLLLFGSGLVGLAFWKRKKTA